MKRFNSVYIKSFLAVALVLLLSFMILGASFAGISYRFIINERTESMRSNAQATGRFLNAYTGMWNPDGLEVRALLMWLSETTGFHIILCDTDGAVISCSDRQVDCPHIGTQVDINDLSGKWENGEFTGFGDLGGAFTEKRHIVGTILDGRMRGGETGGYLFISGETGEMSEIWRHFAVIFFMAAVVVVVISFILSFIMMKHQAKPINEIAAAATKFGRGDFSVRVQETGRSDEIGELAYAFNRMADSLERSEITRRDLIANVSHELKTPMTTIVGFADGILDGTVPQERQREYMEIISSETKRLSRLVRGMLDMSQLQNVDRQELVTKSFDVSEVIRLSLLSLEKKITDNGLDVDARLPEEPVWTLGDKDAITQVVYNLIDNGAKFADKEYPIRLELWKKGQKAYVSVQNHGENISQEELPLIFDRFHKTDRSRSMDRDGVGLGLYIVKTILDNHGEDIFVTSQGGVTTFTFTLTLKGEM